LGNWWTFLPPAFLLALIAFSLQLLNASLDEMYNPRLRRRGGCQVSLLLEARHVTAGYVLEGTGPIETRPTIQAVADVSLELQEGDVLGIAGESGCGKSTLATILAGVVRPLLRVTAGEVWIAGQEVPLEGPAGAPSKGRQSADLLGR